MWTIISGIFGGLLRLAPELFKFLDAKNDRAHELKMQEVAFKFQELKGSQRIDEIQEQGKADWDAGGLAALKAAIEAQSKPSGVRWVDGFNALMRPLMTFQWVILLYPGVIITTFVLLISNNVPITEAMGKVFGESEKALVSFIVDFWFVGRVLDAGRNRQ
jgi:hypothetical protein